MSGSKKGGGGEYNIARNGLKMKKGGSQMNRPPKDKKPSFCVFDVQQFVSKKLSFEGFNYSVRWKKRLYWQGRSQELSVVLKAMHSSILLRLKTQKVHHPQPCPSVCQLHCKPKD